MSHLDLEKQLCFVRLEFYAARGLTMLTVFISMAVTITTEQT